MTKTLGKMGERQAEAFLKKQGYRILSRNYQNRYGEIDIVAQDGEELVFVEVKTRTSDNYGTPEEAVTKRKLEKMMMVATDFMAKEGLENIHPRFEVVSIIDGKTLKLISDIHIDKNEF